MPTLGIPELIIILVIVVLLFGAGRITRLAGETGKSINAFRKALKEDEPQVVEEK